MPFSLGDTFLNKSLPDLGLPSHLWVVISKLTHSLEEVVIVNFTSCRDSGDVDPSCLVNKGEHPFLRHETYVKYSGALVPQVCKLEELETSGLLTRKEPVDEVLLAKVLEGAKTTPFLKLKIRKILEDQYLI